MRVLPFLEEIHHAYSVADIAVARAGASSVFELAAFGIPSVFVPYPYAADDHQMKNVAGLDPVPVITMTFGVFWEPIKTAWT